MCAALGGMLPIDKGVILLAVLIGVGDDDFDVKAFEVYRRIQRVFGHIVAQQVQQAVAAAVTSAVEHYGQSCIQVGIILDHGDDKLLMESIIAE